jgi:hypothetical protein
VSASAAPAPGFAGDERDRDAIDIRASVVLDADAATAWRVLTDYNRYTEIIPDLRLSRVVARHGATVTVEQSGDAALWLFSMPLDITFEITERSPNSLQSRAVAGSLRALASSYALTATGSGMRLDYVGRVASGFELFGHIEQAPAASMRRVGVLAPSTRAKDEVTLKPFFRRKAPARLDRRADHCLRPRALQSAAVRFRADEAQALTRAACHAMPRRMRNGGRLIFAFRADSP